MLETEIQDALSEMWLEACQSGRTISFKIASGSMRPTIEVGDVVSVRRVEPSEIHAGDIVAFKNDRHIIVHRIVRIIRADSGYNFFQMGDAGGAPVSLQATSIIGKVIAIRKNRREVRLDSPKQIIGSRLFAWRSLLVGYISRGQHKNIRIGARLLFRPVWRVCRSLLLWRS